MVMFSEEGRTVFPLVLSSFFFLDARAIIYFIYLFFFLFSAFVARRKYHDGLETRRLPSLPSFHFR